MKKLISVMLMISMFMNFTIYKINAEEGEGYFDTEPKEIPRNLITSGSAIDGQNTNDIKRNNSISGQEIYTVKEIPESQMGNIWYVFGGASIAAKLNGGKYLNLDNFKAGTTYVYQVKVKNVSEDASLVPYYGIANTNNTHGYKNAIGSNKYGKNGMPVTSTEWVNFRDTITYSDTWEETSTGYLGQTLIQGVETTNGKPGAAVAVMKNSVNTDVENSLEDDSLYLAEEIAYDIKISPEKKLNFGESLRLPQNKSLKLNAEVLNQLSIPGTLDQRVEWVVVAEDRLRRVENITAITEENSITLSCDETLPEGKYVAVAISEKYDIKKGIEFEVVKGFSDRYEDSVTEEIGENLIQNPQNSGFATKSSDAVNVTAKEGYVTIEVVNNIETDLGAEGLKVRTVGNNGLSSAFNFEPGKTYVIKAKVRNPEPENETYFNMSISNSTADTLSLTKEYGSKGMLLTEDWQEFTAQIEVSENYNKDAPAGKRTFLLGFNNGTKQGAKLDIELSVFVTEEKPGSITNEILSEDNVLTGNNSVILKPELKNQFGLKGSLSQEFEWVALTADRAVEVEGFEFTENNDGTVTVSATESVPAGEFLIVAYSPLYGMAKGVNVIVKRESFTVYVSPDGDDKAKGDYNNPLKTLHGAKAYVREKKEEGVFDYYTGIDVIFLPGEYKVEHKTTFTNEDSGTESHPVSYKAEGEVIFKGSMDLELDKAKKVTDEAVLKKLHENVRDKVIELDISDYPHDLTELTLHATNKTVIMDGSEYPEIYLDGNEQNLAQWPNGDGEFAKYEYVTDNQFRYKEDAPSKWVGAENWWIGGYPNRDYDYSRVPGVSVDAENKEITVKSSSEVGFSKADNKSKRWKAYNLLEELDEVGEWYIDAEAKKLYYYPPELKGDERLEISCLTDYMINLREAEFINFEDFEFTKTRYSAISAKDIKNISIKNCMFSDLGGSAFYCTGSEAAGTDKDYWQNQQINGAYNATIENCVFNNIGAYGVYISGGNVDTLTPGNNVIKNNFFYKCSQKVRGYPAIFLGGCGNVLEKNNIGNLPFHAVNTMGNDHVIRYNEIYDVCRESEDCAAIYQGRNTLQRGTVVEYNYLHDLYPLYTFTADRYINVAIYWDDSQTGMTVRNNIIRNAKLGIFNNNGVDNTYTGNTIIDTYMAMRVDIKGASQNVDNTSGITGFAGNIKNPELYFEMYKNLKTILETDPINSGETGKSLGRFNKVTDNLFVNTEKEPIISEDCGEVKNEKVSECSDFVNPEAQDYRIKIDSDTYKKNSELLNENFDINLIGANKDNLEIRKDFELYYPYGKVPAEEKIVFQWSEALGATYYRLEISKKNDFKDLIYSGTTAFNYSEVLGIEPSADKYYWRVVAINSSRNMKEEWVSRTGEFYCGKVSVDNFEVKYSGKEIEIKAGLTNEIYSDVPLAEVYVAGYGENGRLICVYKYDVEFVSSDYDFNVIIPYDDEIKDICLFLWDEMTPLMKKIKGGLR